MRISHKEKAFANCNKILEIKIGAKIAVEAELETGARDTSVEMIGSGVI